MSDSTVQIRLAVWDDIPSVAHVLRRAFLEFEPLYTPGGFSATTPGVEQIQARFHEGPVWVAERDGDILGTVAAVLKGEGLYVRSMAVLPSARGQRLGHSLLMAVEEYALSSGCNRMFLSTTPFLDGAIHLYERFGFHRTEDGPHELDGTPLFTMVKPLT